MAGWCDWEGAAEWVFQRSRGPIRALARGLGMRVERVPGAVTAGQLATVHGTPVIRYQASLSPAYAAHVIAHEIGHWALRQTGVDDSEAGADYVAAALLMPRVEFARSVVELGADYTQLAARWGVTETAAALRHGEVERRPLAVVSPALVRVRGPEEWAWPSEPTLRAWARTGGPGLRRARLRDDTRRTVLRASDGTPRPHELAKLIG